MTLDLAELAQLPAIVRKLQDRVAELEARLAPSPADEPLIDVGAAATLLGMTPPAVRAAAYRGSLPSIKVGRRLRFRPSQLARG